MKELEFLENLNGIDADLLEEESAPRKSSGRKALKWVALAAALLVLLGGAGVYALNSRIKTVKIRTPEGESGFRTETELPLVKWKEFKGEIRGAGDEILRQYAEYVPEPLYSSHLNLPNLYTRDFDSAEEAMAYIGLKDLKTPAFPYDEYECGVSVWGDEKGTVNQVTLNLSHVEAGSFTAIGRMTVLTEAAEEARLVTSGYWTPEWPREVEFQTYLTPGGRECRIVVLRPQYKSDYLGLSGYTVAGGAFCELSLGAVPKGDLEEAIGILRQWADALD